ncbi:MAG: ribonuclease T2 family protein [Pikeienuella sp.]
MRQIKTPIAFGLASFLLGLLLSAAPGRAADRAGDFDYYVAALSWNASWCEREGDARDAGQCDPRHDYGFTLHGLWPQHERGWPEFCRTRERDPSRRETEAMIPIMGSSGLAAYQWRKHGRCTGLSAADYLELSRRAWEAVARPAIFRRLPRDMEVAPNVVEDAFLEANPDMEPDGVTIACRDGALAEVRICFTKDLQPRACAPDARRDCSDRATRLPKMR